MPIFTQEDFVLPRFFVSPEILSGSFAVLEGEQAAHAKVLRLSRGDEVTLWGENLPVEEIAEIMGTINYELICGVSSRVKRIVKKEQ